jgi:hypothetical protein
MGFSSPQNGVKWDYESRSSGRNLPAPIAAALLRAAVALGGQARQVLRSENLKLGACRYFHQRSAMNTKKLSTLGALAAAALLLAFSTPPVQAQNMFIYSNALVNNWQSWGWCTLNYNNTSPVYTGCTYSISVTIPGGWQGIQIWHPEMSSTPYANLSFWLNGGSSGGQHLQIYALEYINSTNENQQVHTPIALTAPEASTWVQYTVPLSSLGASNLANFTGFVIQDSAGTSEPTFYLDNIELTTNNGVTSGTNATAYIGIDAGTNRLAISPMIYGVAFATTSQLEDLNAPMNRSGGNAETSYNWQINAHNHAADWYFESIADSPATPGASADSVVSESKAAGAQALITIPMIGWAPILGPGRGKLASYSIAKYGPQTENDSSYMPDAGNGISTSNVGWDNRITWNNPNDANTPVDTNFQIGYVRHLITNWGVSTNGGVGYYIMDNEHTLWSSTHQDVHPVGPTMQEILGKMEAYGSMVKSVDPNALVLGPEEWGWNGYFYSGYDQQWSASNSDYNVNAYPDRQTNGGWDYMPWLLNQLHQYQLTNGQRLLDYFTLHCYPQEGSVYDDVADTATALLRNASTRVFWDSNYTDPSWIANKIMLIPRMSNWVATYYPGTKIGITEYNWGGEDYMNGATAQADILGIFGRQGLDLATRWEVPDPPTYYGIKIYRNYDGNHSTFGDTSVLAGGPDPDDVSVFAAQRSADGALTVMVVNKYLTGNTPLVVNLTNYTGSGSAQVWQLNNGAISQLTNLTYSAGQLQTTVPPQSVTLLVIPPSPVLQLVAGPPRTDGNIQFWVQGEIAGTFVLQSSPDLFNWSPVSTNTLAGPQLQFLLPAGGAQTFYRAVATSL